MGGEGGRGGGGGWKEGGLHEAAGGGLRLAYKLMTTKSYNYAKDKPRPAHQTVEFG